MAVGFLCDAYWRFYVGYTGSGRGAAVATARLGGRGHVGSTQPLACTLRGDLAGDTVAVAIPGDITKMPAYFWTPYCLAWGVAGVGVAPPHYFFVSRGIKGGGC